MIDISQIAVAATSLTYLRDSAHKNAVEKGWHENPKPVGEDIALMHSELSEALEEYRNGHQPADMRFEAAKPEGIPAELADVMIRIFDFCGLHRIDIATAVVAKMHYNSTRPYRHGGKVV